LISVFNALRASKKAKPVTKVVGNNPASKKAPSRIKRIGNAFRNIGINARMKT
jgi:hypothetical protein